jgi:hypothetical protein
MPYDEYGNWYDDEGPDPEAAADAAAKDDADARAAINARYQAYLGRPVESEEVMQAHLRNPNGIQGVGAAIANSEEYKKRQLNEDGTGTNPSQSTNSNTQTAVDPGVDKRKPLTKEQWEAYDKWVRANPGDEGRAWEALGFAPGVSSSTDPTSLIDGTSPVPRTVRNPFGSNAVAATDVGMSNMIERDKAGWAAYLKANWPKSLLDKNGNPDDPGALDGVIRQLSYARNGLGGPNGDAMTYLNQALANAKTRSQSGGPITDSEGKLTGNYNTDWNDLDPSRLGGKDPSAAYKAAMGSLQTQLDAERDPTKRNALQTKMAAMFNGAYVGPPPTVSTLSAITNPTPTPTPTPTPAARPTATPTPSAPVQPYSARATTPYTTAPSAPSTVTSQVPMAGMPAAPATAMSNMLGSTQPQNPYALANAWNTTNANYRQAGDAYAAQQGGNYNPAPWSGTRLGAPRNALGTPTTVGSPNDVALATDAAERRRAYRFGMQNAQANQANAAMGQQDFNGQMDNWLRAYNEWNKKGVDPLAIPGGVV